MADVTLGLNVYQKITSQSLASGALNYTSNFGTDFRLNYITFHFSASVSQTITITIDSVQGVNYDTVIFQDKINSMTDFIYTPDSPLAFLKGDELKIQCTNIGTPASTVYVVASVWQE